MQGQVFQALLNLYFVQPNRFGPVADQDILCFRLFFGRSNTNAQNQVARGQLGRQLSRRLAGECPRD
jgi:hypothetical protein